MSTIYDKKQRSKLYLIAAALLIGLVSMWISNTLIEKLKDIEKRRVELLSQAYRIMQQEDSNTDLNLVIDVISNNTSIPILIAEENDTVLFHVNIKLPKNNQQAFLQKKLQSFKQKNPPIVFHLWEGYDQYLYYDGSIILKQLSYYPFIQLGLVSVFFIIAYVAFSNFRKAEENQVWVGLSKETAHQLGTPISSLMAWVELIKTQDKPDPGLMNEMSKDVERLKMVAERFSKIGSNPDLEINNLSDILLEALNYIKNRASKKVMVNTHFNPDDFIPVALNMALFEWVVENICKNAFDAMEGKGELNISVSQSKEEVHIDIQDNGKGIPKSKQKTIFNPGYTTKKRGWGLGLSLAKRIIENYHNGKIYVKQSEVNKGTTFRITLPIQQS